ncbi:S8 family serine peptidase [Larkinella insperata]|uniref:S8 family serine peptidase n=1 Tax=Larkinella insperata TaxID=332158 RepID=A0ABW3QBW9_9BACT|nr:S8 family serine peptidase [Larkinella insperata]
MLKRLSLLFFALLLVGSSIGYAQRIPLYRPEQQKRLQSLSKSLKNSSDENYRLATRQARRLAWPLAFRHPQGGKVVLFGISETGEPLYLRSLSNVSAARTTHTTDLRAGGSLNLNLTGGSEAMNGRLGIWEVDGVRTTHRELTGRVTQQDNERTADDHATHVSGTLIASGVNPLAQGMAPGANLKAWNSTSDASEMSAAGTTILLSNHSYGSVAGWDYDESGNLTWYGDDNVSQTEDYKFGFYNSITSNYDRVAYNAPYYLPVFSAGNSRGTSGPTNGQSYRLANGRTSTLPRRSNGVYDNIPYTATGKNQLTVGAANLVPGGVEDGSQVQIASFSSTGPTDDGRIKPDLMGAGVNLFSSIATTDSAYATYSGTSMASPNVTGSLFLLQELYQQRNNGQFMRASTLKGLALHTANDAGNAGPDYTFGWGILDDRRAAQVILNDATNHLLAENSLQQGATFTRTVTASGNGPLVVTICWTDPEGTVSTATAANLNNRTPKLVNDLDVRVTDGQTTFQPWVLDPSNPSNAATTGDNIRDNVEQVYIPYAIPGKTYTITITHKGTLQNTMQDYALLVSGIGPKAYCASTASSDQDSRMTGVVFGALRNTTAAGCAAYNDFTNQHVDVSPGQTVPLDVTLGTCGGAYPKRVRAYLDWNADGDFDDANELLGISQVITGTDTYRTTVTVPGTVPIGSLTLLRLVAVETTEAATIIPCGTYGKGETQDYLVRFVRPVRDVAVTGLLSPADAFCQNTGQVEVTVRNLGTAVQTAVPVRVRITDAQGALVQESTSTATVQPFEETIVVFPGSLNLPAGQTYTFTLSTDLPDDQNTSNNQLTVARSTASGISANATAYTCGTDPTVNLRATNPDGTVFWYTTPTGGQPVAVGSSASLTSVTGQTLYAGLNDFSGTVGPATKSVFPGGGYNQFTPAVTVTTYVPLRLESARLYIGNSGRITFTVTRADGTTVSRVTIPVTATRTSPAAGIQSDDPNDPGAVYTLGLDIPQPGRYQINISYADGATIYRNNSGVTGYPFTIPGIVAITGNTADENSATYYYYFYDLHVTSTGCGSVSRTEVPVQNRAVLVQARVTPSDSAFVCAGSTLTLSAPTGVDLAYQWQRDGQVLTGATSSTLGVTTGGTFRVTVTEASGCQTTSSPTAVELRTPEQPTVDRNSLLLTSSLPGANQWYLNGNPVAGATGQTYYITRSGTYTVQNTQRGCVAEARALAVQLTAAEEEALGRSVVTLTPNPSPSQMTVVYQAPDETDRTIAVTVYSMLGQPMITRPLSRRNNRQHTYNFDCSVWAVGTYIIRVTDAGTTLTQRFMKK